MSEKKMRRSSNSSRQLGGKHDGNDKISDSFFQDVHAKKKASVGEKEKKLPSNRSDGALLVARRKSFDNDAAPPLAPSDDNNNNPSSSGGGDGSKPSSSVVDYGSMDRNNYTAAPKTSSKSTFTKMVVDKSTPSSTTALSSAMYNKTNMFDTSVFKRQQSQQQHLPLVSGSSVEQLDSSANAKASAGEKKKKKVGTGTTTATSKAAVPHYGSTMTTTTATATASSSDKLGISRGEDDSQNNNNNKQQQPRPRIPSISTSPTPQTQTRATRGEGEGGGSAPASPDWIAHQQQQQYVGKDPMAASALTHSKKDSWFGHAQQGTTTLSLQQQPTRMPEQPQKGLPISHEKPTPIRQKNDALTEGEIIGGVAAKGKAPPPQVVQQQRAKSTSPPPIHQPQLQQHRQASAAAVSEAKGTREKRMEKASSMSPENLPELQHQTTEVVGVSTTNERTHSLSLSATPVSHSSEADAANNRASLSISFTANSSNKEIPESQREDTLETKREQVLAAKQQQQLQLLSHRKGSESMLLTPTNQPNMLSANSSFSDQSSLPSIATPESDKSIYSATSDLPLDDSMRLDASTSGTAAVSASRSGGGAGARPHRKRSSHQRGVSTRAKSPTFARFTVLRDQELGSGGFGTVYKAFDNVMGEHLAVKETRIGKGNDTVARALQEEFALLTTLDHPNVVKVKDFAVADGNAQIFMEWMSSGSVQNITTQANFRLHEMVIRRYIKHALQGMQYLHGKGIVHRDIKPANMLVESTGMVKLSDFGTSREIMNQSASTQHVVGTSAYMPPESIARGKYSAASDVWAIGCSIVEMATGKPPWSHLPKEKQGAIPLMFHIGTTQPPEHHPAIPEHLSSELKEVAEMCFDFDPEERPSASELLELPYFVEDELPDDVEDLEGFQQQLTLVISSASVSEKGDSDPNSLMGQLLLVRNTASLAPTAMTGATSSSGHSALTTAGTTDLTLHGEAKKSSSSQFITSSTNRSGALSQEQQQQFQRLGEGNDKEQTQKAQQQLQLQVTSPKYVTPPKELKPSFTRSVPSSASVASARDVTFGRGIIGDHAEDEEQQQQQQHQGDLLSSFQTAVTDDIDQHQQEERRESVMSWVKDAPFIQTTQMSGAFENDDDDQNLDGFLQEEEKTNEGEEEQVQTRELQQEEENLDRMKKGKKKSKK